MLSIYFKPDELAALMNHCRVRMAQADKAPLAEGRRRNLAELTEHLFWDSLYIKLEQVFRYPTCVWCDSRSWDLDEPDSIPNIDQAHPYHPHLPKTWN